MKFYTYTARGTFSNVVDHIFYSIEICQKFFIFPKKVKRRNSCVSKKEFPAHLELHRLISFPHTHKHIYQDTPNDIRK